MSITITGASEGRLHLRDGQIVHAEHGLLVADAALRSLLTMPGGTISTAALVGDVEPTIARDFREVLLDALRAVDEEQAPESSVDDALDDAFAQLDEPAVPSAPERMLARVRQIEGYVAACLVLSDSGGVLRHDGGLDLRPAAALTAEIVRHQQDTLCAMGLDDETEDTLITATTQYHLLRSLRSEVPAFVHLVLDRARANPAMAKLALESAVREVDL